MSNPHEPENRAPAEETHDKAKPKGKVNDKTVPKNRQVLRDARAKVKPEATKAAPVPEGETPPTHTVEASVIVCKGESENPGVVKIISLGKLPSGESVKVVASLPKEAACRFSDDVRKLAGEDYYFRDKEAFAASAAPCASPSHQCPSPLPIRELVDRLETTTNIVTKRELEDMEEICESALNPYIKFSPNVGSDAMLREAYDKRGEAILRLRERIGQLLD